MFQDFLCKFKVSSEFHSNGTSGTESFNCKLSSSHLNNCSSIWGKRSESTQMYQLYCKSGKQWEIFKTSPRHPTIMRL